MATLIMQLPNMPPVEHVLKDEAITIGRMKGNTIALDDTSVSLSHAKLTRIGGDYFLKDLNSTNGTLINGQSVTEARLHDGDYVKFGEVTGRYHADSAAVSAQASATIPNVQAGPQPTSSATRPFAPVPSALLTKQSIKPPPQKSLVPMMVVVGGMVVIGFLVWKFVLGDSTPSTMVLPPKSPVQPAAAKMPSSENSQPSPLKQIPSSSPASQIAAVGTPANQDVPSLIQSLKAADPVERRRAAAALNALGAEAKDAVPALREALKDPDAEARMWAALSLISNRVYDNGAIPILIETLRHNNPVLRQVACLSLALVPYEGVDKEPVVVALTESANKDDNAEVRNAAISALKIVAHEASPAGR